MADTTSSVPKAFRIIPADFRELQTVAALIDFPSARARFRSLGVPLHFFDHDGCRIVARWALGGAVEPVPAIVERAQTVPDGPNFMPLFDAIEMFRQGREDWALIDIDRHATAYAARWLPVSLRHWADQMEAGTVGLIDAAVQLDELLTLVRPLVLAATAKEAA